MKALAVAAATLVACGKAPRSVATDLTASATLDNRIDLPIPQLESMPLGGALTLTLTPSERITTQLKRLDRRGPQDFSWVGTNSKHGVVVITSHNGVVIGTIVTGGHTYRIRAGLDGKLHVGQVIIPKNPRLGSPQRHAQKPAVVPMDGDVELLIGYTKHAAASCKDIETTVLHAVAETNAAALATGLDVNFHLAVIYRPEFDESPFGMDELVDFFQGKNDGMLDDVHHLRDTYLADIAILFVSPNASDVVGLSAQTMADRDTAFSVVSCVGALDYYTMTHEIGHLFGLNDDTDMPTPLTIPYGYGYPHDENEEDFGWRTVMSSGALCAHGCPHRALMWSNPAILYPDASGHPSGNGSSDDARVFKETAGAVSRFRVGHP